jgi:hypothetical protein
MADDLDIVQHPVLGTLKFPKAMPFGERNSMIDKALVSKRQQLGIALNPAQQGNPQGSFMDDSHWGAVIGGPAKFFDDYVNKPLNAMAQAGSEVGRGMGEVNPASGKTGTKTVDERSEAEIGIQKGVGSVLGGAVADPRNWPFLAAGGAPSTISRIAAGGFSTQMAKGAVDSAKQYGTVMDNPDVSTRDKAEIATGGITSAVMAGLSATGVRKGATPDSVLDARAQDIVDFEARRQATIDQTNRAKAAQEAARRPMSSTFQMTSTLPTDGTAPVVNRLPGNPTAPLQSVAPFKGEVSNGITQFGTSLPSTPSSGGYDLLAGKKEVPVSTKSATKSPSLEEINAEIARRQNANKPATDAQTQHVASPTEAAQNAAAAYDEYDRLSNTIVTQPDRRTTPRTSETSDVMVSKLYSDLRASTDPVEQAQIREQIAKEKDLAAKDAAFKQTEKAIMADPEKAALVNKLAGVKSVTADSIDQQIAATDNPTVKAMLQQTADKLRGKTPVAGDFVPDVKGPRLPSELQGAAPRFGYRDKQFTLQFQSDVDKAAFIAAQPKLSARDADFVKFGVDQTGMNEAQFRQHGADVRSRIKAMAAKGEHGETLVVPELPRVKAKPAETVSSTPPPPVTKFDVKGKAITPTSEDASLSDIQAEMARRQQASKPIEKMTKDELAHHITSQAPPTKGVAPETIAQAYISSKSKAELLEMAKNTPSGVKSPTPSPVEQAAKTNSVMIDKAVKKLQGGEAMSPEGIAMMERATGLKLAGKDLATQAHDLANWTQKRDAEAFIAKHNAELKANVDTLAAGIIARGGTEDLAVIQKRVEVEHAKVSGGTETSLLNRQHEALKAYLKGSKYGTAQGLRDAIDAATRWKERGVAGGTARRYTDPELSQIAKAHVGDVLNRYEHMTDEQLRNARAIDTLTSSQLERQMGIMQDPALAQRLHDVTVRAANAHLANNPITALRTVLTNGLTPGDLTRGDLRQAMGSVARKQEKLNAQLEAHLDRMDGYSIEKSLRIMDDMEHGRFDRMAPDDATAMKTLRTLLDDRRNAIAGLGTGKFENYIENYFPHLWSNVGKMRSFVSRLNANAPFEGTGTFLKPRYYDTVLEGVQAGLEPLTYNPTKMALLRLHEMDKYLMAHEVLQSLERRGIAQFVEYGKEHQVADGYTVLNDKIFRSFKQLEDGTKVVAGRYYAPKDAALPINNHLAPGLRGSVVYDIIRSYNNAVNQATLSLSAFHATETAFNAAVSDMALAVQNTLRGDIKSAILPGLRAVSLGGSVADYYTMGKRITGKGLFQKTSILGEYANPGTDNALIQITNELERAGVRVGQDAYYRNNSLDLLGKSYKQFSAATGLGKVSPVLKMAHSAVGAILQKVSGPIMDTLVPNVKMGAAYRMAQDVMRRMPDAHPDVLRNEISKAVDSVDNRFGQVIYDNYFMSKVAKDLGMIGFRSLGWNMGTFKELGGGTFDLGKAGLQKATGRQAALTQRAAYTLALPIMAAYVGALVNYAYTGKAPETMTDYWYPQDGTVGIDGKPNRIYLKTYMHDVFGFYRDPVATVEHKAAPWLSQSYEMIQKNADYYGTEIRHKEDPMPAQLQSLAKYWVQSSLPITIQNYKENERQGKTASQSIPASLGIIPAPRSVGQSPAEQLAYEYAIGKMPGGSKTTAEFQHQEKVRTLEAQLSSKNITQQDVVNEYKKGNIAADDVDNILDNVYRPPLERHFKRLDPERAIEVYNKANPSERERLKDMMYDKWDGVQDKYQPDVEKHLNEQFKHFHETYGYGAKSK